VGPAIIVAVLSLCLASVTAGPARAADAPDSRAPTMASPDMSYRTDGGLAGVAAASSTSAWAVGYTGVSYSGRVLLLHWNGTAWSRVTSPAVLTGPGQLTAVTVVSARDAWAVGSAGDPASQRTLLLHWNGTAWREVTDPAPVASGTLSAVTASAKGGWAVGYYSTGPTADQTIPLSFQLNGTRWSRLGFSSRAGGIVFDGAATTTTGVTWASGLFVGQIAGVLARWAGSSWEWTSSFPGFAAYHWLTGIAAGPGGTAYSIGFSTAGDAYNVIALTWTGQAWASSPVRAPARSRPSALAAAPGGAVWAAGYYRLGAEDHPLVLLWDGSAWAPVPVPDGQAELDGLSFPAADYGWAVGHTDPASGNATTVILHWDGYAWS
jgi:hypothetical protein